MLPELSLHLQGFVFLISKPLLRGSGEEVVHVNGDMYFYKGLSDECSPPPRWIALNRISESVVMELDPFENSLTLNT